MYADLHLHSTFSDGTDTPMELCNLAADNNVQVISITDHDATSGIKELQNQSTDVTVIPGIEISSTNNRKMLHVLGYYIDIHNISLAKFLKQVAADKTKNTKLNFEKALQNEVFAYSWERVLELSMGQPRISGAHVVKSMQLDQYEVPGMDLWDMFCKHFLIGGDEYIEYEIASGYDAVDIIKTAGGIPVIAHPKSIENDSVVLDLLRYGAQGLEVYHSSHTAAETEKYLEMAESRGCYVTGGSDWHGKNNRAEVTHFAVTGLSHSDYGVLKL